MDAELTYGPGEYTLGEMRGWLLSDTSTIHGTDMAVGLVAALERIRELEQQAAGWQQIALKVNDGADYWQKRAERVEAAARPVAETTSAVRHCDHDDICDGNDAVVAWMVEPEHMDALRAALSDAPAPAREGEE